MKFKYGYLIKPLRTSPTGVVEFTNGTNLCNPNQAECEAYGYTWNKVSKTCVAWQADRQIAVQNTTLGIGNKQEGVRNTVEAGSFYNNTNGADNAIGKGVQNSTISGRGNVIDDNILNASVSGSYAKVQRQAEIVVGGGNFGQDPNYNGFAQSSTIHAITRTSGSGTFIAGIGGVSGAPIPVQSHSVIIFDITGTVIKEAGGDNWQFNQRIVATMQNNKQASYCNVSSNIDCGPAPEGWIYPSFLQLGNEEVGFGDLQVNVSGLAEINLTYNLRIELIETRTVNDF